MPRKLRLHIAGGFYHVMLRGNGGNQIFFDNKDRKHLQQLMSEGTNHYGHRIHAYCWMDNHIHIAIQVGIIPLSKIMHNLSFRYSRYLNKKLSRIGHTFQARYKAILIEHDAYLLSLVRYIHLNPVKAKLVNHVEDYCWSSHNTYLGLKQEKWLTTDYVLSYFSKNKTQARQRYSAFILSCDVEKNEHKLFHENLSSNTILGSDDFINKILGKESSSCKPMTSVEAILSVLVEVFDVTLEDLSSSAKNHSLSKIRYILAYFVLEYQAGTLKMVGQYINRCPTTLSRGLNELRKDITIDLVLQKQLKRVALEIDRIASKGS